MTSCLLISNSARLTSLEQIRPLVVTQVEVMARKHPCPIAACPNAEMWTDKDTYKAWKQKAAVRPLTDNSLSEKRASEEEQVKTDRQHTGLNVIRAHHQLDSAPPNTDLCHLLFI